MEKASFLFSKIDNTKASLLALKSTNPNLYYLLDRQLFKLKKILDSIKEHHETLTDSVSVYNWIQFALEGIERLINSLDIEYWLKEKKGVDELINDFVLSFKKEPKFLEKIIEIKHILDEVSEISAILSGKIPD
ncbi:MAG: hypothetical protein GXO22_08295 [Aquificae bacterium]|nr:hypothetical protein [Aquificota bacterium]